MEFIPDSMTEKFQIDTECVLQNIKCEIVCQLYKGATITEEIIDLIAKMQLWKYICRHGRHDEPNCEETWYRFLRLFNVKKENCLKDRSAYAATMGVVTNVVILQSTQGTI